MNKKRTRTEPREESPAGNAAARGVVSKEQSHEAGGTGEDVPESNIKPEVSIPPQSVAVEMMRVVVKY